MTIVNDNLILCGLQLGQFELIDMRVGSSVFHSTSKATEAETRGALSAISSSYSGNLLATGSSKGVVGSYNVRFLSPSLSSLATFRRNDSGIEDLCFMNLDNDNLGLVIATGDGLPFVANVSSGDRKSRLEQISPPLGPYERVGGTFGVRVMMPLLAEVEFVKS